MRSEISFALVASSLLVVACSSPDAARRRDPVEGQESVATPNDPTRDPTRDPAESEDDPEQPTDAGACLPKIDGGELKGPLPILVTGDTTGFGNDVTMSPEPCRESVTNGNEDVTFGFTAETAGTYRFTAYTSESNRFGITLTLAKPTCAMETITCQAYDVAPGVETTLSAGERILIVVDPLVPAGGGSPFVLKIEKK